jgi:acetoin utilization protein AcuB
MLVSERMIHPVLTINADIAVQDALTLMKKDKVRRYPVVDKSGKLIGIVTESDLMNAKPSEATTLSVWEISSLLAKITVERVMCKKVITVTENTTLEEAARIMADSSIGGLPVMRGDKLVGIITESDLFRIFLEMLGARRAGVRVTVEVPNAKGTISKLTTAISQLSGDILGFGAIQGESADTSIVTLKVADVTLDQLKKAMVPLVTKILDIREDKGTV